MEEKLRFVFEYEQGDYSMTELCERREISRETGYVWLRRYPRVWAGGLGGARASRASAPKPDAGQDLTLPSGPRARPIGDNEASAPLNSRGPLEKAAALVQLFWRYSARVRDTIPDDPTT